MNDQIKEAFKILSEQRKQTINDQTFSSFLNFYSNWLTELSSKSQTKFTIFSSPKKFFIECIYLIRDCCVQSPENSSKHFDLILSIFIMLLNPFNDFEIIHESLSSVLQIIHVFIDFTQVTQWDELFLQIFSFSPTLMDSKLNIGNKGTNTKDVLLNEIRIIINFVHEINNNYDYFFIWRIICRKCTTLIRLLFNKQTTICEEISQIFLREAISYLKRQQICSFLGQIPNIPRSSNLMSYDKLIPREICWMLSILQDPSNFSQQTTKKDEICYYFLLETFPFENLLQIDKEQYPISELQYYLLSCYSSAPQKRMNEAIACLCYDTNNCDSFSQIISVVLRLFFLFLDSAKIHIKLATLLRSIVYLHLQYKPGLFFPGKYILMLTLQPENMFPSLLTAFLSVIYDNHEIKVDDYRQSIEILTKYVAKKNIYKKYVYILSNIMSQITIAMMHSIFEIKTTIQEIQLCEKNPVIFGNIFIQNELLKSIDPMPREDIFMFHNLPTIKLPRNESMSFILNFLEIFDESVHYFLTPVLAETLLLLLMIIPPSVSVNNSFLFHTIFPRLLDLFFKKEKEIDITVYVKTICKIISSNLYKHESLEFKTIVLWNKASKLILSKHEEPTFSVVYFTAVNLFLNSTKYSVYLAPLLVENALRASSKCSNEQRLLLFSTLASIFSIVRNNKSLEKYGLSYQKVTKNCLLLINSLEHNYETVSNGLDQFVTYLFIDEVLRIRENEKFDEVLWETVYNYIISCIAISENQPFLFLSLPISILKRCVVQVPFFFTAMTTFCSSLIDSSSYEMTSRILVFVTNTLIVLPRDSPEGSVLFQFFVPKGKYQEIEKRREEECNLFFHTFMKKAGVRNISNPQFSSVILQLDTELQLLCSEHEKSNSIDLSISTHFGSSSFEIKSNHQSETSQITNKSSAETTDQESNKQKGDYSCCLSHFMNYNPFPMFIDALSELNDNKTFNYIDETVFPQSIMKSVKALASRFAQRNHKIIASISIIYSNTDSKKFQDLISTNWDETSNQFKDFVNSVGKLQKPNDFDSVKDIQNKMRGSVCAIRETLRMTTVFNIAPLFDKTTGFDSNNLGDNPIIIVWEEKMGITDKYLLSKMNGTSFIFIISQLNNGYYRVKLMKPSKKNYSTLLLNPVIIPAEILSASIAFDTSLIYEQIQAAKQNQISSALLFKPNWEEFFI